MSGLYESQKLMRNMRNAAIQRGAVAVLDIGTFKISCLVLQFDRSEAHLSGADPLAGQAFRVIGARPIASRGVRAGEIAAMRETEGAMRAVLQAAQKMASTRVDHVLACFSGGLARSYGLAGEIAVGAEQVDERDVGRVLAACDMPDYNAGYEAGREILHAQPVNFELDGRSGLRDPRGQVGRRLKADVHMVTVDAVAVHNLAYCVRRCDLELAGLAPSAYVSGVSALVEDEQELGGACIDIGAGTTGVSIFFKKHMIYIESFGIGGEHVTKDISRGLGTSMQMAERIKTVHGGLVATGSDDREMIRVGGDTGDFEHDRRSVTRAELIGVIRPRMEEILEEARKRLDAGGFDHLPSRQIVLTGGGSQIPGVDELAGRILGQRVRLGRPMRVRGLPSAMAGPGHAAAVGMSLLAATPQDECWDFDVASERFPTTSLRRAAKWLKENW